MSLELLTILEEKIQSTLDTVELLNLELEEEKEKNIELSEENKQLKIEHHVWNEKVTGLVNLLREDNTLPSDEANQEATA